MHIVHLYDTLDPRNGGPPFVVAGLTEGLTRLGHQVTLASADPADADPVNGFLDEQLSAAPRRIVWAPPRGVMALRRAIKRADVVHLHGVWHPMVQAAARLAQASRVPYVLAPHGMLSPANFGRKGLKKKVAFNTLGYRSMVKGAAALHVLNPDEADAVVEGGFAPRDRLVVVPNGVFPERYEGLPAPGGFRFFNRSLGDDPFILFLSRLHAQKGLDLLARAFAKVAAQHQTVRLVVAGPDQGYAATLEREVQALGIADRVLIPGPQFGPDKLKALVDAALFCLPSYEEGFSMAITEAMVCGLPVVISEPCHFPEVGTGDAGRVVPLDADALAQGLLEVLNHPEPEAMGQRGRALVLERYTWPAVAERLVEVYQKVAQGA